jgi:hypothetical protein
VERTHRSGVRFTFYETGSEFRELARIAAFFVKIREIRCELINSRSHFLNFETHPPLRKQ